MVYSYYFFKIHLVTFFKLINTILVGIQANPKDYAFADRFTADKLWDVWKVRIKLALCILYGSLFQSLGA